MRHEPTSSCRQAAILALALLLLGPVGRAQAVPWPNDGRLVARGSAAHSVENAGSATVCANGAGGAIVAYKVGADAAFIQSQAVGSGPEPWGPSPTRTISNDCPGPPHVTTDRRGGAWVAWYDDRPNDPALYVQHFDQNGIAYYSSLGSSLAAQAAPDPSGNKIAVDTTPEGHLIVAWQGTGTGEGVWVQRIEWTGQFAVLSSFAKVSTQAAVERIQVVADGEGAIVVWSGARNGDQGIWGNRVDANGNVQWGPEGRQIMNRGFGPSVKQHTIDWSGTSLYVAWSYQPTSASGLRDVYVQRVNGSGATLWGSASFGLRVLAAPNIPDITSTPQQDTRPQVVANDVGGCTVVWRDVRNFFAPGPGGVGRQDVDLYGQRVSLGGAIQWATNGQPIDTNAGTQKEAELVATDGGGVIVVYTSFLNTTRDIWARRIDAGGSVDWTARPCDADGEQQTPTVASNGAGGFVVAWEDGRHDTENGDEAIYVTQFDPDGGPIAPALDLTDALGDVVLYPGMTLPIEWTSNLSGQYELGFRTDGQAVTPIANVEVSDGSFDWTIRDPVAGDVTLRLTSPGGDVFSETTAAFSICDHRFEFGGATRGIAGPRDAVVGDFLEDGVLDVVVAGDEGVTLARGQGNGTFGLDATLRTSTNARAIVSDDFDEDGIDDLAVATLGTLKIYRGGGSGTTGDGSFQLVANYGVGAVPYDLLSADFDEDGIADLLLVDGQDDLVYLLLGDGSGGLGNGFFEAPVGFSTSPGPRRAVTADFNGDSVLDLAVTCETAEGIDIFRGVEAFGSGVGSFNRIGLSPSSRRPWGLAAGDFDEDGNVDLVVGDLNDGLSVSLGNGDGSFALPVGVPGGSGHFDLVLGDFTGDGRTDVAAVGAFSDQVDLYAGSGNGETGDAGFDLVASFATGRSPEAIVAGDFDDDRRADLLTMNRGTDDLTSLLSRSSDCRVATIGMLVRSPEGGEIWPKSSRRQIVWDPAGATVAVDVEVSRDLGVTWDRIARGVTGDRLNWYVTAPLSEKSLVRVRDTNIASIADASDAAFEIADGSTSVPPAAGVPHAHALHPATPNPFNPKTSLRFDLPRRERASMHVYDVAGRRIRTLVAGAWLEPGAHGVVWDGRDDTGRFVASGVYQIRIIAGQFTATRRAVLIK